MDKASAYGAEGLGFDPGVCKLSFLAEACIMCLFFCCSCFLFVLLPRSVREAVVLFVLSKKKRRAGVLVVVLVQCLSAEQ